MRQVKTGIIGLGVIGRTFLREMRAHASFEVVAAWDPNEAARAAVSAEMPDQTLVDAAEGIFTDPDIELVYVASPPASHCEHIEATLAAGKAV